MHYNKIFEFVNGETFFILPSSAILKGNSLYDFHIFGSDQNVLQAVSRIENFYVMVIIFISKLELHLESFGMYQLTYIFSSIHF